MEKIREMNSSLLNVTVGIRSLHSEVFKVLTTRHGEKGRKNESSEEVSIRENLAVIAAKTESEKEKLLKLRNEHMLTNVLINVLF